MWPIFIIACLTALAIREITKDWGWNRDWKKEDIPDLLAVPGVYIFYSKSEKVIHVGSTGNLLQQIGKHEKKYKNLLILLCEAGYSESGLCP